MLKKDNSINMVNVLIRNKDNHALLIHNIKHNADRWEFTGGKLEEGVSLEEMACKEPFQEFGIKVRLIKINGTKIFGDYRTQTPEGPFYCRTYFAEIIEGEPEIKERDKHDGFIWAGYAELLKLEEKGVLVPNLVSALPKLKKYIDS